MSYHKSNIANQIMKDNKIVGKKVIKNKPKISRTLNKVKARKIKRRIRASRRRRVRPSIIKVTSQIRMNNRKIVNKLNKMTNYHNHHHMQNQHSPNNSTSPNTNHSMHQYPINSSNHTNKNKNKDHKNNNNNHKNMNNNNYNDNKCYNKNKGSRIHRVVIKKLTKYHRRRDNRINHHNSKVKTKINNTSSNSNHKRANKTNNKTKASTMNR